MLTMAGDPGGHGAGAARPAGTELREGRGAATTRGLEPAAGRTPRPGIVRHSRSVQLMEVGEPGAPILPAAKLVVEGKGGEPDSATTLPHLMAGQSVRESPVRQRAATPRSVDQDAG